MATIGVNDELRKIYGIPIMTLEDKFKNKLDPESQINNKNRSLCEILCSITNKICPCIVILAIFIFVIVMFSIPRH